MGEPNACELTAPELGIDNLTQINHARSVVNKIIQKTKQLNQWRVDGNVVYQDFSPSLRFDTPQIWRNHGSLGKVSKLLVNRIEINAFSENIDLYADGVDQKIVLASSHNLLTEQVNSGCNYKVRPRQ